MVTPLRHELVAPGLHRYVFASESVPGKTHDLLYDETDDTVSCLCEAALFGRPCKHEAHVRSLRLAG